MIRIKFLMPAKSDLNAIEDYYADEFDIDTALKVSDNITGTIKRLVDFPNSGTLTPDPFLNNEGFRMIICERHVAFTKRVSDVIYVYCILDSKMEYVALFKERYYKSNYSPH